MNIGLIGYGYWGRNLLRNIMENGCADQIWVCDQNEERLSEAKRLYAGIHVTTSWLQLIQTAKCEAIIIATPTSSHFDIAKAALLHGKHVLVEKPMTTNIMEAEELIELATSKGLVLMVDHTFLYNAVVRRIKEEISLNKLGQIYYIDSTRINLGLYQYDTNVLWDLACHDISIINYLVAEKPSHVRAIGRVNKIWNTEDMAYLFLQYASGLLVQISASWASPVKIRRMIIGAEKKMMIYDDIEPTNKLIIHDYETVLTNNSRAKNQVLADYRLGNISIPKYEMEEPLKMMIADFFECICTGKEPVANSSSALEVIQILQFAGQSLKDDGRIIALK